MDIITNPSDLDRTMKMIMLCKNPAGEGLRRSSTKGSIHQQSFLYFTVISLIYIYIYKYQYWFMAINYFYFFITTWWCWIILKNQINLSPTEKIFTYKNMVLNKKQKSSVKQPGNFALSKSSSFGHPRNEDKTLKLTIVLLSCLVSTFCSRI